MKNDIVGLDLLISTDYKASKNTGGDLGNLTVKFIF